MSAESAPIPAEETTLGAIGRWTAPMRGSLAASLIAGLLVVGLGSRLAMFLIAQADPDTEGTVTDSQAIVGEFTLDGTLNLIALGGFLGILLGPIYLGIRRWMPVPRWIRGLGFGYGAFVIGGLILINPENVDFRIFEPVLFSIFLFAAIFVIGGFVLGFLTDRFHPEPAYPPSVIVPRVVGAILVIIALLGSIAMLASIGGLLDEEGTCVGATPDFECIPARVASLESARDHELG